jgi:predicted outer membrane protein
MLRDSLIRTVAALAILGVAACGTNQEPQPVQDPAAEEPVFAPEVEPAPIAEETDPTITTDTALVEEQDLDDTVIIEEPAEY